MTAVIDRPAAVLPSRRLADRRPPLARLVGLEIRKSLCTRSGIALAGAAAVLPAGAVALMMALNDTPPNAATMLALLGTLVSMLLIGYRQPTTGASSQAFHDVLFSDCGTNPPRCRL